MEKCTKKDLFSGSEVYLLMDLPAGNENSEPSSKNCPVKVKGQIDELRDLLGRLHNQKVWYRPKGEATYVGG